MRKILSSQSANEKVATSEKMVASFDTVSINRLLALPASSPKSSAEEIEGDSWGVSPWDSRPYSGLTFECKGQILVHSFRLYCRGLLDNSIYNENQANGKKKASDCIEKMLRSSPTRWGTDSLQLERDIQLKRDMDTDRRQFRQRRQVRQSSFYAHFNLLRLIEVGMEELEAEMPVDKIGSFSVLEPWETASTEVEILQKLLKAAIQEREAELLDFILSGGEWSRHFGGGGFGKAPTDGTRSKSHIAIGAMEVAIRSGSLLETSLI